MKHIMTGWTAVLLLTFTLLAGCVPTTAEPAALDIITVTRTTATASPSATTSPLTVTVALSPTATLIPSASPTITATPFVPAPVPPPTEVPLPSPTMPPLPPPTAVPLPSPSVTPTVIFDCATVSQIPPAECQALFQLYLATAGYNWFNQSNWVVTVSPCEWYGVTCNEGHVVTLDLSSNRLAGIIPAEIGNLTYLTSLSLNVNNLSGSIPAELGALTNLTYLYLSVNQLTGPVPPELGNLTNLRALWLGYNQLSGPLPPELGNLTNLFQLFISDNQLSGTIPAEWGNLTGLLELSVAFNPALSGPLPLSLTNLPLLTFQYEQTELCEPADEAFHTWLATISSVMNNGVSCNGQE